MRSNITNNNISNLTKEMKTANGTRTLCVPLPNCIVFLSCNHCCEFGVHYPYLQKHNLILYVLFFISMYFDFCGFLFLINFLLEYSWFTMLCYFQVHSKVNQLYIYIYPVFLRFYSHIGHYRALSRLPCAIQ